MSLILDQRGNTTTTMDVDELTGDFAITTTQDVSGFLDRMKSLRQMGNERWEQGKKEEWMLYASIPNIVIMQLKQRGIDIFNPDHEKKMLQVLNREFPYLKTVDHKTHE